MSDEPVPHIVDEGLLQILQSAQEDLARDLASEIKRLQARITSLEAEIANYDVARTPLTVVLEQRITKLQQDNASLGMKAADALQRLQERENQLAQLQAEVADHNQEMHRLRAEQAVVSVGVTLRRRKARSGRAAEDSDADLQSDPAKALVDAQLKLASLAAENERLRLERFIFADRAARIEEHNRVLAASATKRESKLQVEERELTRARIHIVNLEAETNRLKAERSAVSQQAEALEHHNRLLTESATDLARQLERCEGELTQLRFHIPRLDEENKLLRIEHDRQAKRASEFQAHVSLLTESATETARRLQQCEAELMRIDAADAPRARRFVSPRFPLRHVRGASSPGRRQGCRSVGQPCR
jgi:chromosome segregation ATPase